MVGQALSKAEVYSNILYKSNMLISLQLHQRMQSISELSYGRREVNFIRFMSNEFIKWSGCYGCRFLLNMLGFVDKLFCFNRYLFRFPLGLFFAKRSLFLRRNIFPSLSDNGHVFLLLKLGFFLFEFGRLEAEVEVVERRTARSAR